MARQKKFNPRKAQKELQKKEQARIKRDMKKRAASGKQDAELAPLKKRKKKKWAEAGDEKQLKKVEKESKKKESNGQIPLAIGGAVVLMIGIALIGWFVSTMGGGERIEKKIWFYNEGASKLIPVKSSEIPPIEVNGQNAVRAYVYSCGDCKNAFVAYLEYFTEEAKIAKASGDLTGQLEGQMIRREGDSDWVKASDDAGKEIIQEATSRCPDRLKVCNPEK